MRGVRVGRNDHFLGWLPSAIPGQAFMLCAWSDCARNARGDYQTTIPGDRGNLETYAFCSRECQTYWLDSPRPRAH